MPAVTITIKDETALGKLLNEMNLSFSSNLVTVREIITERVKAEVEAYNNKMPEYYKGLIQPNQAEATLNGFKLKKRMKVDAAEQLRTALDAFNKNGYFVLIDNIQAESLEQMVVINEHTQLSFIKLTPLVGG